MQVARDATADIARGLALVERLRPSGLRPEEHWPATPRGPADAIACETEAGHARRPGAGQGRRAVLPTWGVERWTGRDADPKRNRSLRGWRQAAARTPTSDD